jgi:polyisoprenoid-binding protein YceI
MVRHLRALSVIATALALMVSVPVGATSGTAAAPLGIDSARITIAGTSNVHAFTATTTTVRVTAADFQKGLIGDAFWNKALEPGVVDRFEIAIPAATLKSDKDGLDKNMYKALKTQEHADITFRLVRFEASGAANTARAIGMLRVAGVEREVAFDVKAERKGAALAVSGIVDLLMTDYGITPPKAMLGMLKTDPKIKVTFEAVIGIALT